MESDNLAKIVRQAAEQQRIVDNSFAATIKGLEASSFVRLQKELQNSSVVRLHAELQNSSLVAALKEANESAARMREALANSETIRAAQESVRSFNLIAEQAAESLRAFDSIAKQAAEQFRYAYDNSAAAQARKYIDEQAVRWQHIRNSVAHQVDADVVLPGQVKVTVKAVLPKLRVSPQAKQTYTPAPVVEPKIEMPPVHWLASALEYVLTKGSFKRTVEPILVDIRDEYYELISNGDERRAKWIVARGCLLVIQGQIERPLRAFAGWLAALRGG
jgi:hypothetical protein